MKLIFDLRAQLYCWIATGTAFLAQSEAITEWNDWTPLQWARTGLASFIAGGTALRAYVDQSLTRNQEAKDVAETRP